MPPSTKRPVERNGLPGNRDTGLHAYCLVWRALQDSNLRPFA